MNLTVEDCGSHLLVRGRLFLSSLEAETHFRELEAALARWRRTDRPVRVLVDLSRCPPQSADVAEIIKTRTASLYRPEDRVAIIAASAILKLQLKRIHADQNFGVFLEEDEARGFLVLEPSRTPTILAHAVVDQNG